MEQGHVRNAILCLIASVTAFGLSPARAVAGSFSISPVRVDLSAQAGTGVVTLRNQEDQPLVVQAEVHQWRQVGGKDELTPTRDLLVTPVVFTVPPKGAQVVRLALRRAPDAAQELSYRLLLTEVPQPKADGTIGLNFALQMNLPVFVAAQRKTMPELAWSGVQRADGSLVVTARNTGTEHARVLDIEIASKSATGSVSPKGAIYVLPGQSMNWVVPREELAKNNNDSAAWRAIRVKGTAEHGKFAAEFPVANE